MTYFCTMVDQGAAVFIYSVQLHAAVLTVHTNNLLQLVLLLIVAYEDVNMADISASVERRGNLDMLQIISQQPFRRLPICVPVPVWSP